MPTSGSEPSEAKAITTTTLTTETHHLTPLEPLNPDLHERAWCSTPHPTLPLLATAHGKSVTVFSLSTLSSHSSLTGGHTRSVRCAAWKPNLGPNKLCLVTGSFDSTAGMWRWEDHSDVAREKEITADGSDSESNAGGAVDWEFTLVLEGHDSEIKSCAFSPSGGHLATCSRDKSVWVWEDIGASEADDEWETIAVLNEHEADVKALAWCPDVPGRSRRGTYGVDVLASASYDDTVRVWREDSDAEWVCVAVLEGHAGTVWGIEWERRPRAGDKFPRLLSFSADSTIRLWTLDQSTDEDSNDADGGAKPALGGIPNTMRRSLREDWTCTATLPKVHSSDVYAAAWSPETGLVASTGSDGLLVLYQEDVVTGEWSILEVRHNAHGPYEVNHAAWCKRWDDGVAADRRGVEEMLVTTGDDGLVRPWQLVVVPSSTS
ncbi:WD40 repeat [Geosmithia morbida]|uniref:Probable cytosolic iron-sulfur protein assembly protein 1 n=1 Tax=Geosmithia morbida TaxID=1094350 RepID=A0A9P4YRY5_9HYPO|nr:WD40 repeat [Geosmithia morbida]KAF4120970.1 WD40 repeat [Geosmithia morbida]